MGLLHKDKDATITGNMEMTGLVSVDRLAPNFYPDVEVKKDKLLGAFPIYNKAGKLCGWVPMFDAELPYTVSDSWS